MQSRVDSSHMFATLAVAAQQQLAKSLHSRGQLHSPAIFVF